MLAGPDNVSVSEVASAPKVSFETEITDIPMAAFMEVQGLDAAGNVLAGRVLQRGG